MDFRSTFQEKLCKDSRLAYHPMVDLQGNVDQNVLFPSFMIGAKGNPINLKNLRQGFIGIRDKILNPDSHLGCAFLKSPYQLNIMSDLQELKMDLDLSLFARSLKFIPEYQISLHRKEYLEICKEFGIGPEQDKIWNRSVISCDIYLPYHSLDIEIDGKTTHSDALQKVSDKIKQKYLKELEGITTIRLTRYGGGSWTKENTGSFIYSDNPTERKLDKMRLLDILTFISEQTKWDENVLYYPDSCWVLLDYYASLKPYRRNKTIPIFLRYLQRSEPINKSTTKQYAIDLGIKINGGEIQAVQEDIEIMQKIFTS